jgi:hypothetical protein
MASTRPTRRTGPTNAGGGAKDDSAVRQGLGLGARRPERERDQPRFEAGAAGAALALVPLVARWCEGAGTGEKKTQEQIIREHLEDMDKSLQNAQIHVEDAKVVGAETGVKLKAQTGTLCTARVAPVWAECRAPPPLPRRANPAHEREAAGD